MNKKGNLSVETQNIFPIIRQWLYSDRDIFVRELISNATDAISKRQGLAGMGEADAFENPEIEVVLDLEAGRVTFSDNGIGMTSEEIDKYINQIAFSGAVDFMEKYKDKDATDGIIGHFGLGFYSSFLMADKVEINTLSCQKDAKSVRWESEDGITYEMSDSDKSSIGTDIVIHLSEEGKSIVTSSFMTSTLNKYCRFMQYPIYFKDLAEKCTCGQDDVKEEDKESHVHRHHINEVEPLWLKAPKDCKDEEYISFYHTAFGDYRDPLFWIHLNLDYPFRLKGILYFPPLDPRLSSLEGRIRLFSNRVFVADNIREILPDFLFLLKGCIDCPDIPLNVSRSFLQQDEYVKKLRTHIVKKVADRLLDLNKKEPEKYESSWKDISTFVKYGIMSEDKFTDKMDELLLLKTWDGKYVKLPELGEKVYYTKDASKQGIYVDRLVSKGEKVVDMPDEIDNPLRNFLTYKNNSLHFISVDEEMESEKGDESLLDDLKQAFTNLPSHISIETVSNGANSVPALLVETAEGKNMREMNEFLKSMGGSNNASSENIPTKLQLNTDHKLIKDLAANKEAKTADLVYGIARLARGELGGNEMASFIKELSMVLGGAKDA